MSRPAETISAIIGAVLGAITIIRGAVADGFSIDDVQTITGAIMVVVGLVAPVVTYFVAKRQRNPSDPLSAAEDGSVVASPGAAG